jgi:hypothetical protein
MHEHFAPWDLRVRIPQSLHDGECLLHESTDQPKPVAATKQDEELFVLARIVILTRVDLRDYRRLQYDLITETGGNANSITNVVNPTMPEGEKAFNAGGNISDSHRCVFL